MFLVVCGVSGVGKTSIGMFLARELGWTFYDADDFHPAANLAKLRAGVGLTDEDRAPWLTKLRDLIDNCARAKTDGVLACSALKRSYRQLLRAGGGVKFVYLKANPALIAQRLADRPLHFMNAALLSSQFADLEEPSEAITVDASKPPVEIVAEVRRQLRDL